MLPSLQLLKANKISTDKKKGKNKKRSKMHMWSGVNSIKLEILDWLLNVDWACSKAVLHGNHSKKVRCHPS